MKTRLVLSAIGYLLSATLFPAFAQGSLTPPGAPAPTMKSLEQIASAGVALNSAHTPGASNYLFIVGAPGNYYLPGNLAVSGTNSGGIYVAVPGVTIDLNGFQMSGGGANGTGVGIAIDAVADGCVVKNGAITGFDIGIDCLDGSIAKPIARGGTFSKVTVSGCNQGLVAGRTWMVEFCNAHDNLSTGIQPASGSSVTHCVAGYNLNGILAGAFGVNISDCSANNNASSGIVSASRGGTLVNCNAADNNGNGFGVGAGVTVVNCTATDNGGAGINAGQFCTIKNCTCLGQTNIGIVVGDGSSVIECTVAQNNNGGISGGSKLTITGCTVASNAGDGISYNRDCFITRNNACGNGGDGIRSLGQINRLEGNLASENGQFGILWNNDLVMRNNAFLNSFGNYTPAVGSGNSGPIQAASSATNPAANF